MERTAGIEPRLRLRAFLLFVTLVVGGLAIAAVYEIFREPPYIDGCAPLTDRGRAAAGAYRTGAFPVHAAVAMVILGHLLWLNGGGRRTLTAVGVYVGLLVAAAFDPEVFAVAGAFQGLTFAFWTPALILAALISVVLLLRGRGRAGVLWSQIVGCGCLVLPLPAHFAYVWFIDQQLCL